MGQSSGDRVSSGCQSEGSMDNYGIRRREVTNLVDLMSWAALGYLDMYCWHP